MIATISLSLCACGGSDDASQADGSGDASGAPAVAGQDGAPSIPSTDLTGKMLDELEGVTTVLKGVKDEATAKAAAAYITEYAERNKVLAEQFKNLTMPEQVASAQKNAGRNMNIQMALQQEIMRIGLDPALSQHMSEAFNKINRQ